MRGTNRIGLGLALALSLAASTVLAQPVDQERLHHQERAKTSPILASYDFEEPTPSGPDTHWIRQRAGGVVGLSDAFRVSGERSLHISEARGNRDFAEFLAYFRERREGDVYIQFYLLLTDTEQRFNFGLAGQKWFLSTEPDGQAIWLQTAEGGFRHRSAEGWEELFAPRPFAWYFIDIVLHVERGTYDLRIKEEGLDEPVVDRFGIRSMNGPGRTSVKYFSLIGDLEDQGTFDFFVDDLLIATVPGARTEAFVAPGRRRFFVDRMAVGPRRMLTETQREDLFYLARQAIDVVTAESPPADLDRLEAIADEAFWSRRFDLAFDLYERLALMPDRSARVLLKLADVAHLQGDVEAERQLRESIYGSLALER
jgi:hypothetical protein